MTLEANDIFVPDQQYITCKNMNVLQTNSCLAVAELYAFCLIDVKIGYTVLPTMVPFYVICIPQMCPIIHGYLL